MSRLLIVFFLTAFIHLINTLIYSVRLSGVKTKRLAIALSLFNVIFIFSSMANTIQAPLLSSIVENTINQGIDQLGGLAGTANLLASVFYQEQLDILSGKIRLIIVAATLGTVVGALLIPSFVGVFVKGIYAFERVGSIPKLVFYLLNPWKLKKLLGQIKIESPDSFAVANPSRKKGLPPAFLFLNIIITGIYTIGVLSALYAGALLPSYRSTATVLASVINGVATVLLATIVDPTAAMITDQALQGERSENDVKNMVTYLALTRIGGTLLAQVFFIPASVIIVWVTKFIV